MASEEELAAGGEELLVSPALAGVDGVRRLPLGVLATGAAHGPHELVAPGGRRMVATGRPLEHDGRRLAAVLAVDATEWARTEAALRESERRLSGGAADGADGLVGAVAAVRRRGAVAGAARADRDGRRARAGAVRRAAGGGVGRCAGRLPA